LPREIYDKNEGCSQRIGIGESMNFLPPFVHETAILDHPFKLGNGTKVWHYSHINSGAEIGEDCMIGNGVFIGKGVKIGNGCRIQNGAQLFEGTVLGNGIFIGPRVIITNAVFPRANKPQDSIPTTTIRDGATIGAGAIIKAGITIGEGAFVGMGAVVTKDVISYGMVYGNPARVHGTVRDV
jgi:UDP-2-acetamido-3-amino-2,3-dideoxy-glucuronate N-acetyltransferase